MFLSQVPFPLFSDAPTIFSLLQLQPNYSQLVDSANALCICASFKPLQAGFS